MAATDSNPHDTLSLASLIVSSFTGDELRNGKYHGHGMAHFSSGNTYCGPFANGYMDGSNGVYTWADGVRYEGDFHKNNLSGVGLYVWKNGCRYEGQVLNGLRHGKGVFYGEPVSKAWYNGDWKEGKVHGQGKLVYNDSDTSSYEGAWLNGMKHGRGLMRYASGNVYDGEWELNVKKGLGTMTWNDRGEEYTGEWQNGLPNGSGTYTWTIKLHRPHQFPVQNRYDGQWLNGKRHGHGIFQYANGARYEGEWMDNMKHGQGRYISENGRNYVGLFQNDRPVGDMPKYQNDCPYMLQISDIVSASSPTADLGSSDDQLKQINNVILRYIGELRSIYQHYTAIGRNAEELATSAAMTRVQLVRLLKDCKILEKGATLADMDRAYAIQFKDHPCFEQRFKQPHNPSEMFILYDFISFLLRVSHLIYKGRNDLSIHDRGLAAELAYLIKEDILPYLRPDVDAAKAEKRAGDGEMQLELLMQELEKQYGHLIYALYADKARHKSHGFKETSPSDVTMTIREVLLMMKEYGLLHEVPTGPLTIARVISVLAKEMPYVEDGGYYNLEFELVPYEVFELIYACAMIQHEDYYRDSVLPLLNNTHDTPSTSPVDPLVEETVQSPEFEVPDPQVVLNTLKSRIREILNSILTAHDQWKRRNAIIEKIAEREAADKV
ncbi:hypothetical protein SpCBS45565_g06058 [Spizellomyces sp. 'palustris']|nr:hypothetical protein SpCBS45565_g06058 [Spizellomyces sp. 'palustris']